MRGVSPFGGGRFVIGVAVQRGEAAVLKTAALRNRNKSKGNGVRVKRGRYTGKAEPCAGYGKILHMVVMCITAAGGRLRT
jgi:hypothetical protein